MTKPVVPEDDAHVAGREAEAMLGDATDAAVKERVGTLWTDAWHQLRRSPMFLIAAAMITLLIVIAIAPGLFTSVDPTAADACKLDDKLKKPGTDGAIFGYNTQGCEIYPRMIYGARASILVGLLVTIFTTAIGGAIGALAGYLGGWGDAILSRFTDMFFALPLILGSLVLLSAIKFDYIWGVVSALTLLGWVTSARVMRSSVISNKSADYVMAARGLGSGPWRIMRRHILPNSLAPLMVVATISLGIYISIEATLSFLGIGLLPPTISWGVDISDSLPFIEFAPHALLFPAGMLSITVLSFILLGESVRDALDPKLR